MIDREKVIKGLECLITNEVPCDGCPYNEGTYCMRNIANDALELLKLQEPARAVREFPTGRGDGSWWYVCGNCLNPVSCKDRFCKYCGKRLKWDD